MTFIDRMAKAGHIQPFQHNAAQWLREEPLSSPVLDELAACCAHICRETHVPGFNLFGAVVNAVRSDHAFRQDQKTIGMVREALNCVARIKLRQRKAA